MDDTWVSVHDPRFETPAQGWKLHVSARPGTLAATLDRVLPVLFGTSCDFKAARSADVLGDLNSGDGDAGAVGKAVTVYPAQDEVAALGHALAGALAGMAGPRIVSDRRVRRDAPVYYRYAPFLPQYKVDENGDFALVVVGPDGETLPGAAGVEYTCPPWASDPFRRPSPGAAGGPTSGAAQGSRLIGGRYRVTTGVMRGPRGSVYRAEAPDGRPVVVKEARAYVGERADGFDLRMYLRNELRVLRALAGVQGVPEPLDHFRHGEDEYLVMTDAGSTDLNRHVAETGAFTGDGAAPGRDLAVLASGILEVLDAVHACGVVVRDLSPKNIVLGEDGGCTLIDFGTSRYEDLQMPGWSRGFSVPDQRTGRPSTPADDYFSLGATLFYAATGMNPVIVDPDPVRGVERTLQCLSRIFPGGGTGTIALLPRLLSLDPAERTSAAAEIRTGRAAPPPPSAAPPVRLTGDLLSAALAHTTREVVRYAERLMEGPADARRSAPPVTNVYSGSAGVGMELLQHPEVRAMGADLARWTAASLPPANLPPSLYFGLTGTAVFLAAARTDPSLEPVRLTGDERADQAHGLAGIGTGHLILASLDPDGDHLATATRCARRLLAGDVTEPEALPEKLLALEPSGTGLDVDTAYAHGDAGVADFLLAHHLTTGDAETGEAARERFASVAKAAEGLVGELASPSGRPMGASWCQGMSGVATALLHAGLAYDDAYLNLAARTAHACTLVAPRAWVTSQCCGLAGIGEALIDVAQATGDDAYWRHAEETAELMLIRAGGPHDRPIFPGNDLDGQAFSWGTGTAGVLSFLRRLNDRTAPRLWAPSVFNGGLRRG
ncbi:class IV lanthionine synthetase LanL [Spirillospora sp. CA-142024]|uniref:class IV lanthionine synthetase LanL n=1 Tax=Spirillospora sp. CA-142024 TaxID=3240036 RepID=UPI003D8B9F60